MKTKFTKNEINLYTLGFLLELKQAKNTQKKDTAILDGVINQINDRLERQARRKK